MSSSILLIVAQLAFFTGFVMEEEMIDKDRIIGSAKVVKGNVKEAVGKAVGAAKLETQGKADKIEGKVQNAIGGLKDAVKDAVKGK